MSPARRVVFVTHAEVEIDPASPIDEWPLSQTGRDRHAAFDDPDVLGRVGSLYCSRERKAVEAAILHSRRLDLPVRQVTALHENDRSATGYLPPDRFERRADAFFARPDESLDGWETARAAQARIVAAIRTIAEVDAGAGDILIVAHGGVGALLRCDLLGVEITRAEDQPGRGGNWFIFDADRWSGLNGWSAI